MLTDTQIAVLCDIGQSMARGEAAVVDPGAGLPEFVKIEIALDPSGKTLA